MTRPADSSFTAVMNASGRPTSIVAGMPSLYAVLAVLLAAASVVNGAIVYCRF